MDNFRDDYNDEYEIDLREYILLLWDNKLFILGMIILAAAAAFIVSTFIISAQYESRTSVRAPEFELINEQTMPKEEYIFLLSSDQVLEEITAYVNQDRAEDNQISAESLLNRISYELAETTNQIDFSFQHHDPEKSAAILAEWIKIYINKVENFVEEENSSYYQGVSEKNEEDFELYQNNLQEMTEFKRNNNLEFLENKIETRGEDLVELDSEVMELTSDLKADQLELEHVESRLDNTEQYMVKRNLISDEFLQKLQFLNDNEIINLLSTEEEFLNPAYEELLINEVDLSAAVTSQQSKLDNNKEDLNKLEAEIESLQRSIADLEEEKTLLEGKVESSNENYQLSQTKLNELDSALAEKNYEISILSSAKVPTEPVSPNTELIVVIAVLLAAITAVFIVFVREFIRKNK